jgi:transcriptional regulator with PAS, ATPase and Fis domain
MDPSEFIPALPFAVTVCDAEGIIIHMNPAAEALFANDGGRALLGSSLYDCHPPRAQEEIRTLMRDRKTSTYTVEKPGKKRLIHQAPWYRDGEFAGLVEISFEIPLSIPNYIRK